MHIKKINNNKFEIFICIKDLEENKITVQEFMSSSINRYIFLFNIIKISNKEIGFCFKNCKMILESFFIPNIQSFIVTISKTPYKIHKNKYHKLNINTCVLAKFKNFDTICAFCNSLNLNTMSSLFYYNNFFYLSLKIKHISDFNKVLFCLKEFTRDYKYNFFVNENANLIVKNDAIQFCKRFAIV